MNRVIKFRAWDKRDKKWIGLDIANQEDRFVEMVSIPVAFNCNGECDIMQYTGLKDKNGKEIYEGDIVGIDHVGGELEAVGEVVFDTDFAQFTVKYTSGGWAELWEHLSEETNDGREVIGNIYENGELLDESE